MPEARPNVRVQAASPRGAVYSLDLYRMQERLRGDIIGAEPDAVDRRALWVSIGLSVVIWVGSVVLAALLLVRLLRLQ